MLQSDLKTHVRHGSGHNSGVGESAACLHVPGGKQQDAIAVHDVTLRIAEQGAIGITIEGRAQIKMTLLRRHLFGNLFGMECAAAFIDVHAVGRSVKESRLYAACPKQFGSFCGCSAVRAIHQHPQLAQIAGDVVGQPFDIGTAQTGITRQTWCGNFVGRGIWCG